MVSLLVDWWLVNQLFVGSNWFIKDTNGYLLDDEKRRQMPATIVVGQVEDQSWLVLFAGLTHERGILLTSSSTTRFLKQASSHLHRPAAPQTRDPNEPMLRFGFVRGFKKAAIWDTEFSYLSPTWIQGVRGISWSVDTFSAKLFWKKLVPMNLKTFLTVGFLGLFVPWPCSSWTSSPWDETLQFCNWMDLDATRRIWWIFMVGWHLTKHGDSIQDA